MTEGSRWTPISPRMLGMYRDRERVNRHQATSLSCKLVFTLAALAGFALLVMIAALKLAKSESEIGVMTSQPSPSSNYTPVTEGGDHIITSQQETIPTAADVLETEPSIGRNSRSFEERARIVNRPLFPDQDGAAFAQLPAFSDGYPQLEGYRPPVRGFTDLMSWVEPSSSRPAGVKFSGVYFKAEEARPYLNGHAYVSDPFVKFKPSHPAEINHLAVEPERSNRFSNRPADSATEGSHTTAIFHPYTPLRPRPLKLMLDIYPMVPESSTGLNIGGVEGDPRVRRPRLTPTPTGRMIVHLNLYPKKNSRISRRRPTTTEKGARQRIFDGQVSGAGIDQLTTEASYEETTLPTAITTE